ncbi:MAG: transglutaminase family protein [Bacteroidales bacterium]|jgi:regulator of sirC expression with transglutaminase-like and TPR domain|nr:transglutaminase family protein [Bacteroidales bacterium]MDD3299391.1 transglutaminase family protein [Bacteroidales bacterium]MDD3843371.1 transglutaminase family protein [Bacteroidales bacterium]MDD4617707.1 transglutaminase family protein [Bacteroidales bacterium]
MRPDSELISLVYLMEDPDPVVRNAVKERLMERGEEAIDQIERYVIPEAEEAKKEKYISILAEIKADIALDKLSSLLADPQPKLDMAMYLITRIADPFVNDVLFFQSIEELSDEIAMEISEEKTPVENVEIFNYLFFKRIGFKHLDTRMQDSEKALMDRVLLSRGGNPVTVTLVYFLLAGAVGLPIYPLCFPGGFVPVYLDNDGKILFYLNIFKKGAIFVEDTLRQFFEDIGMVYSPDSLRVEQERALLSIYAELLAFVFRNNGDNVSVTRMERVVSVMGGKRFL